LSVGVPKEVVETIKHRRPTAGLDETDAIIIDLGREVLGKHKVSSETYARALKRFGASTLIALVALMGNYTATAAMLVAFDMQLDDGQPPLLPV
jgi:4-carboxymuconolactone decarboxylase